MMTASELRQTYIDFFKSKNHIQIPGASLIPENDGTVLFTTAGMHPLVPFLAGEKHPAGTRLVNCQKCIRTGDIDEVGDESHLTFFEMLGNWSLGEYFKKEAIEWSYEFLTEVLSIPKDKLSFSVFEGDEDCPRDLEAAGIWKSLGVPESNIFFFPKKENWWGPAGQTGPCGPDTEMFYDTGSEKCSDNCNPSCSCGKYLEIWNDVFMQYNKNEDGTFSQLSQKNVDTGMGLDRVLTILQKKANVFETELFKKVMTLLDELAPNTKKNSTSRRIIADHIRTATFLLSEGVVPGRVDQPYILRRVIRRAVRHGRELGIKDNFTHKIAEVFIETNGDYYTDLVENKERILSDLSNEENAFRQTINKGEKKLKNLFGRLKKQERTEVTGEEIFELYATYGFPPELTEELAAEKGFSVNHTDYEAAFEEHQALSRKGAEQKFSGGLADNTDLTTALHTATHLLHEALRRTLGDHVAQKGSNITAERLRFDFSHPEKITREQLDVIEALINEQIKAGLPISMEEMSVEEAKAQGAIGLFGDKYGERVKVYTIGTFSKEICGGPHADSLDGLGTFKIKKETSSSAGIRRIKAVLIK
jgi:alanyl-tRNA synthetase